MLVYPMVVLMVALMVLHLVVSMDAWTVVHLVVSMDIHWVVPMAVRLACLKVAWMDGLKVACLAETKGYL